MNERTDGTRSGAFFARRGRKLAWALTSPSTILLAGGVVAAGILAGLPALAVGAIGAATYAVKVAGSTFTGKDVADLLNPRIDMSGLRPPYVEWVERGIASRDAFRRSLKQLPTGPLNERLAATASEMDEVLDGLARVARRAQGIDDYLRRPGVGELSASLARAEERLAATKDPELVPERSRTVESLREQSRVATRLAAVHERAMSRMESTITSLDQLGAQLVEVQLAAEDAGATETAPSVDDLIAQLHTVSEAVAELDPHRSEVSPEEIEVEAALPYEIPSTGRRDEAKGLHA